MVFRVWGCVCRGYTGILGIMEKNLAGSLGLNLDVYSKSSNSKHHYNGASSK